MSWDFSVITENVSALVSAFMVTLELTFLSIVSGTVIGVICGVSVLSPCYLSRIIARIYIEVFLALPVLVIVVWVYYVLPMVNVNLTLSGVSSATIGLTMSLSAFVAEIIRAGIGGIPSGEIEVAYCLGMNRFQSIQYIVLPQAARKMWPPLMGQYITCYKMSTLASIVAVDELLHTGGIIISQSYRPIEVYTAIAIIFIVTVIPINIFSRNLYDSKSYKGIDKL
jgi:polar amino acid transport system permease protein